MHDHHDIKDWKSDIFMLNSINKFIQNNTILLNNLIEQSHGNSNDDLSLGEILHRAIYGVGLDNNNNERRLYLIENIRYWREKYDERIGRMRKKKIYSENLLLRLQSEKK